MGQRLMERPNSMEVALLMDCRRRTAIDLAIYNGFQLGLPSTPHQPVRPCSAWKGMGRPSSQPQAQDAGSLDHSVDNWQHAVDQSNSAQSAQIAWQMQSTSALSARIGAAQMSAAQMNCWQMSPWLAQQPTTPMDGWQMSPWLAQQPTTPM